MMKADAAWSIIWSVIEGAIQNDSDEYYHPYQIIEAREVIRALEKEQEDYK